MTGPSAVRPGPVPVSLPVPALGDVLPVTLWGEPRDGAAERPRHDVAGRVAAGPAPVGGVLIGISGVEIVDSFLGRVPADTSEAAEAAGTARLPATRTVLAGTRPAVAITLVEPGLALPGPDTAPDVDRALSLLGRVPSALPPAHPEGGA
ncbi:anti-anti-sigma factor [Streptomyces nogalater]|uniref:Anti-anti-sigma factor n=1 Tax=Streptomyces nogalater TaxID=38314 RepID=A0ABW0WAA1_STRNO